MKAEIIAIGSELTSGDRLDTNTQYLSSELAKLGIAVAFHTTVSDDLGDNVTVFRAAIARADLVLITGGLGPTQDDLTREVMAQAGGVSLVLDEPSLEAITARFAARKRPMPERNRVQALFPAGSTPIPNPNGTAPGIWQAVARPGGSAATVILAAMPGVPSEMKPMWHDWIAPHLREHFGIAPSAVRIERKIRCFGSGESHIESQILDLTARGRVPEVGITAHDGCICIRVSCEGPDLESATAGTEPTVALVRERLGKLVFGEGEIELEEAVVATLRERDLRIAIAEGCTGGEVAARLVSVPGASQCFAGGIVAYDHRAKGELLHIPAELIARDGAAAPTVVQAMAESVRRGFHTDLGLAIAGTVRPDPESDQWLADVAIAVAGPARTSCQLHHAFFHSRPTLLTRLARIALNDLRWSLDEAAPPR